MMSEQVYHEASSKQRSRLNLIINTSLIIGLIILIVCQLLLFSFTMRERTRTTGTLRDGTGVSAADTDVVPSSALRLTSCSDDDLVDAVSSVKFAVVNIDVASSDVGASRSPIGGRVNFDTPSRAALRTNDETLGSGIIVDARGYVLTCYHLIENHSKTYVTVFSADRKTYRARLIDVDVENDLAVLKIDSDTPLPAARLGNSDMVAIIDTVLAIGSPFGFEHTVTAGIVSDNKRSIEIDGRIYRNIFQTDASINRGSAGGALINGEGEVIGVNTAIASTSGYFAGISFAIPINRARVLLMRATEG